MSQRRQEARKAEQDRRRQERRDARVQQRRTTSTRATGAPTKTRAPVPAPPPKSSWVERLPVGSTPLKLGLVVGAAVVAVAIVAFLIYQNTRPLPGVHYDSNGNQHVDPGQEHGAYFTNPPTSGWHNPDLPRSGIYANPRTPEQLPHFMEHGGVWVTYTCIDGCPDAVALVSRISNQENVQCAAGDQMCADIKQLTSIVNDEINRQRPTAFALYPPKGYQVPEHRINVIAWQRMLSLDAVNSGDIKNFIERLSCRYNPEGMSPGCSQVKGSFAPATVDAGSSGFNPATVTSAPLPTAAASPAATPAATVTLVPSVAATPSATAAAIGPALPSASATPAR